MKRFILNRLREPSTWAGIVALATGLGGLSLDEEQRAALIQMGMALAGVLFVFTRESPKEVEEIVDTIRESGAESSSPLVTKSPQPSTTTPPTRGLQGRVNRNK